MFLKMYYAGFLALMEGKIPRFWAGIGMTAGTMFADKANSFASNNFCLSYF
jgi:hypothetical protein